MAASLPVCQKTGFLNGLFAESKSRGLEQYSCQTLAIISRTVS